ncbi:MAG: hypothetical protein ACOYJ1_10225 [Peptococcales bacterium]|jgi:hypothetical protein
MKIEIPKDKDKILKQIQALEWQLKQDTNPKDKVIHQEALKDLKTALRGL